MMRKHTLQPIRSVLALLALMSLAVCSPDDAWAAKSKKSKSKSKASSSATSSAAKSSSKSSAEDAGSLESWAESTRKAGQTYNEQWSVFVKDMDTGATIFSYGANDRLIPASNRKIMIFALAMEYLGPEYRFRTEFGLTPSVGGAGSCVALRSNGDPTMEPRFLNQKNPATVIRSWVAQLRATGVTQVKGDVLLDASAFGGEQDVQPDAWGGDHINFSYAPRPSALAINGNLLEVRANARKTGSCATVDLFPSNDGVNIVNSTKAVAGSVRGLDARFCSEDSLSLNVGGRLGSSTGTHVTHIPVSRPLDYIRALVESEFKSQGIGVTGQVRVVTDPNEARKYPIQKLIASHESPPLIDLLQIMMRDSDNFLAEQIWRATAFRALGRGDPAEARRLEKRWLQERGLTWIEPGYDGSGLSRKNFISASELTAVLEKMYRSPYRGFMLNVMPQSGISGTLRGRTMGGAAGRVVAKTGTLSGAQALAGFIRDTQGRERWAFAMIGNAPSNTNGRLKMRQDQIMKILFREMDSGGKPRPAVATSVAKASPVEAPAAPVKSVEPAMKRARPDLKQYAKGSS